MTNNINFAAIKMLVMDVDGTLTDGKIYYNDDGEFFKAFNVKDGYRLIECESYGIIPVIITGKISKIVDVRAKDLKIKEVHQHVADKAAVLSELLKKYSLDWSQAAYIGDDVNDLDCMQKCGISACPRDAMPEVIEACDYICKNKGGDGAVRELIDLIIKGR